MTVCSTTGYKSENESSRFARVKDQRGGRGEFVIFYKGCAGRPLTSSDVESAGSPGIRTQGVLPQDLASASTLVLFFIFNLTDDIFNT